MNEENDLQSLEPEVRRLEQLLDRERATSRRIARYSIGTACFLLALVVFFSILNVVNFRREWTEENISRHVERQLRELQPAVGRELRSLSEAIWPVYAAETRKQLKDMSPEIQQRLSQEIDNLSQDILLETHKEFRDAQERVLARTEHVLFQSYPNLQDAEERERLSQRFREITEEEVARTVGQFDARFGKELDKIEETLSGFDLSDSDESTLDLQKKFLHLWLQLLDQEIMAL